MTYESTILYFTSTAAQVWAALVVFLIFFDRDKKQHALSELHRLHNEAKLWWPKFLERIRDVNAPRLFDRLKTIEGFNLTEDDLLRADTDVRIFIKLIKLIKKHSLISTSNFAVTANGQNLNPTAWQKKFDPIADKVEELEPIINNDGLQYFIKGLILITINLIFLTFNLYFTESLLPICLLLTLNLLGLIDVGYYILKRKN